MAFRNNNSNITATIRAYFEANNHTMAEEFDYVGVKIEELKTLVNNPSSCTTTCSINEFPIADLIAELERIVNDNTIVNLPDLMLILKAATDRVCKGGSSPSALIAACEKFKDKLEKELSKLSEVNLDRKQLREDIKQEIDKFKSNIIVAIPATTTVDLEQEFKNSLQSELDKYQYNPLEPNAVVNACLISNSIQDHFGINNCITNKVGTSLTSTETLNSCIREVQKAITTLEICHGNAIISRISICIATYSLPTTWTSLITDNCATASNSTIQNCIATNLQTPFDSLTSCIDKNELIKNQNNASLITSDDLTTIKNSLEAKIEDYISTNYITSAAAKQALEDVNFDATLLENLIPDATVSNILNDYKNDILEWVLCENVML